MVSLNVQQAEFKVHSVDTTRVCFIVNEHITLFTALSHVLIKNAQSIFISVIKYVSVFIPKLGINSAFCIMLISGN